LRGPPRRTNARTRSDGQGFVVSTASSAQAWFTNSTSSPPVTSIAGTPERALSCLAGPSEWPPGSAAPAARIRRREDADGLLEALQVRGRPGRRHAAGEHDGSLGAAERHGAGPLYVAPAAVGRLVAGDGVLRLTRGGLGDDFGHRAHG